MHLFTQFNIVTKHLALRTQRGLLSELSTPQPHAMPTSSPSYTSNGEMDDTQPSVAFLSPPPFLYEWKEMNSVKWNIPSPRASGGRGNEAWRRLSEVSQSQSHGDPVTHEQRGSNLKKWEASETADAALKSVWIMMGQRVTEWLCGFSSPSVLRRTKTLSL